MSDRESAYRQTAPKASTKQLGIRLPASRNDTRLARPAHLESELGTKSGASAGAGIVVDAFEKRRQTARLLLRGQLEKAEVYR